MEPAQIGFVAAAPLTFAPRLTRTFCLRPPSARPVSEAPPRRRARFLALGGAAAPPPPPEENEDLGVQGEEAGNELGEGGAEDILSSPVFLKKKLEVVQKELAEAKKAVEAADELVEKEKDSYVRLAADFENYRRRSSKDLLAQDAKATAKVCREILGVLDNFERAILAVDAQTEKEKAINSSYQAINKQLLDALNKLDVTAVEAVGEQFNPEVHDAIQNEESKDYAEGVVSTQYQRGYTIGETLIRPALVVVSSGPGPDGDGDGGIAAGEEEGAEHAEQVAQ